jgi:hypothetical protein
MHLNTISNKTFSTPKIINSHSFNVLEMGRVSILWVPYMHEEEAFFMYRNLYRRHIRERRQQVCIHEECLLYKFLYST